MASCRSVVVIPWPNETVKSLHFPQLKGIGVPISVISNLMSPSIPIWFKKFLILSIPSFWPILTDPIFPELDFQKIENNIEKKKFFYLKKKLTPQKSEEIKLLGEKSLILEPKITRIYPDNNLLSHTMGQIDDENFGV